MHKKVGENGKNIVKLLWFMYVGMYTKMEKKIIAYKYLPRGNSVKYFIKNESIFLSSIWVLWIYILAVS